MVVTLEPEIELEIKARARRQKISPEKVIEQALRQFLFEDRPFAADSRQAALAAIQKGKYAIKPGEPLASERFAASKAEEKTLEERRWRA